LAVLRKMCLINVTCVRGTAACVWSGWLCIQFLSMFTKLQRVTVSFVMSVCSTVCPSTCDSLAPTGWIFIKFDILAFFEYMLKRYQFSLKSGKNVGYCTWSQYTFLIISHSFILRMKNVLEKSCREYQNTHFIFSDFFQKSYCLWDMWKNIAEPDRQHMTIWLMCIAWWIRKATNTHSEYIILIDFPRQRWLHEHSPVLHYTYTTRPVM